MGRWILPVLIVLMAPPRPAVAQAPSPAPPEEAVPEFRYAVEPGESVPGDEATMTVDFALNTTPGAPLQFLCRIESDTFMPDAWIRMQVIDQQGKTVYETPLKTVVRQGYNLCQFLWDADKVPFGVYSARFVLMRGSEFEEARSSLVVSKLAEAPLARRIEEAARRVDDLTRHLDAMAPSGPPAPYARIRLAVAQDFAERARSAFARPDWKRAGYYAAYAENTAESVRIHLTLMPSFPELFSTVSEAPLAGLRSQNGGFQAAGRPVFLAGWRVAGNAEEAFRSLRRYGLNFAALEFQPAAFQPGPVAPVDEWAAQRRALDLAEQSNVSVAALLSPFEVAGSDTLPIDLIDPGVRESVADYLRTAARVLRNEPMISGVAIVQKPAFRFAGPEVNDGFIHRLHELYPDVRALNLVWKARLRDIEDVQVDWEPGKFGYHVRPSFQYDWQTYHQWLATGFLAWMQGQVASQAPTLPTFVEFSEDALAPGETRIRPDRAAVAPMMDLTGCAVADSPLDPVYAMRYPHASLLYTLMKSLAPEKALVNTDHVLIRPDDPYGRYAFSYVHSALWEGAMSGLNGSALSGWAPGNAIGLQGTFLDRPECVEGYATASRDLNRLADLVAAFQRMPARVAILWSMPAKIYEDGEPYLGSMIRAYEGCSFAGQKLRFITEQQIEAGELESVDVLIMPNLQVLGDRLDLQDRPYEPDAFDRVKAYIDGGGVVIRTGNPISADARGRSHGEIIVPTERTILVRGTETASNYLDAMDAAYAMGALPPTPRAVNQFGYPVEGVRTLFTEIGGEPYLYMLNLRKEPVMCKLEGHYRGGRDLIRGDRVEFPFAVPSLSPMLIRLDAVDLADVVPTARVGETPAPPERVPRPEGVPGTSPEPYPAVSGPASTGQNTPAPSRLNRPGPE